MGSPKRRSPAPRGAPLLLLSPCMDFFFFFLSLLGLDNSPELNFFLINFFRMSCTYFSILYWSNIYFFSKIQLKTWQM
jgi:hypothetical protein